MSSPLSQALSAKLANRQRLVQKRAEFHAELAQFAGLDLLGLQGLLKDLTGAMPGFLATYASGILSADLRGFERTRRLIDSIPFGQLRQLVSTWHRYLEAVISTSDGQRDPILVGFNTVADTTLTLDQAGLDALVQAIVQAQASKPENRGRDQTELMASVLREAKSRADGCGAQLQKEASDAIDVLALVILAMQGEGLKPLVREAELQLWLEAFFKAASTPLVNRTFGGAAGNEVEILDALGHSTLLFTPYHDSYQAAATNSYSQLSSRLMFAGKPEVVPLSRDDGDVPRKISLIFQLTKTESKNGPYLTIDRERIELKKSERLILTFANPRAPDALSRNGSPKWTKLIVAYRSQCVEISRDDRDPQGRALFADFGERDWPWFPVFQKPPHFDSKKNELTIRLISPEELGQIPRKLRGALLGGLQTFARDVIFNDPLTRLLKTAIQEQLRALTVPKHFECSGKHDVRAFTRLMDLLRAAEVGHLGMNREELVHLTSQYDRSYHVWRAPVPGVTESAFTTYLRAATVLAKEGVATFYVHDLELDLLVLKNPASLDKRNDQENARRTLANHRQAMLLAKVAVPASLIQRAGHEPGTADWDFVLASHSLIAMLVFADEYAKMCSAQTSVDAAVGPNTYDKVFKAVIEDGYYYNEGAGVSVAVAPGFYLHWPSGVTQSGAGDKCFAVHASSLP